MTIDFVPAIVLPNGVAINQVVKTPEAEVTIISHMDSKSN